MGYYVDVDSMRDPSSILDKFTLRLTAEYISKAMVTSILLGLLCLACFVLAVVFIKKARGLGIVAAVMQFLGMFGAHKFVVAFSQIDFSKLFVVEYGSSYDEAYGKAMSKLFDAYLELIPKMGMYNLWSLVITAAAVITLIYIGCIMKSKGKVLAVFAFIFAILRVLLTPVNLIGLFSKGFTLAGQVSWDGTYRFIYLLPAILIAVFALVNIKKTSDPLVIEDSAPAVDATPVEEETLAVEAEPVAELPAEETVSTNE